MGLEGLTIRRATPDDAAGVARVINEAILGGSPSLLDTPFSEDDERAYIQGLPARAFIHVAELPGEGIVGVQTITLAADYTTRELDHVATMGTWVAARLPAARHRAAAGGRVLCRRPRGRLREDLHRHPRRQPRLARLPS